MKNSPGHKTLYAIIPRTILCFLRNFETFSQISFTRCLSTLTWINAPMFKSVRTNKNKKLAFLYIFASILEYDEFWLHLNKREAYKIYHWNIKFILKSSLTKSTLEDTGISSTIQLFHSLRIFPLIFFKFLFLNAIILLYVPQIRMREIFSWMRRRNIIKKN